MSTISDHVWTQTPYRLRFEWGVEGVRRLAPVSELVVIIDVLSFTTCVEVAVSRDAVVFPYRYRDDLAIEFAQSVDAILAGNRGQSPSLSPASLLSLPYRSRLVLPSPNGSTCTVIAQDLGVRVLAGCLRNATAIASYIRCAYPSAVISLIACGEQWPNGTLRPAVEDLIGAGAILSQLDQTELSPESKIAVGAYEQVKGDLPTLVERCSSGRELMAKGFEEDVTMAGQLDEPGRTDTNRRLLLLRGSTRHVTHRMHHDRERSARSKIRLLSYECALRPSDDFPAEILL